MVELMMLTKQGNCMKCQVSPNGKEVFIEIDPSQEEGQQLGTQAIYHLLETNGYGKYKIYREAIDELVRTDPRKLLGPVRKLVAEKCDTEIEITVDEDEMAAWLRVLPPQGGAPLTLEMLQNAFYKADVSYGIMQEVLDECLRLGSIERTLVAKGTPVQNGEPAWFEYLVKDEEDEHGPTEQADGRIDYFELNIVQTVLVGEPLLRKHLPTPGVPGMTVRGVTITPNPGKNFHLAESKGSAISEEDSNLLIATRAGKPIWNKYTVKVDDVFTVDDVGVSTGNIRFGGSVIVRGTVNSGFKIDAGGDIIVMGSVDGAVLNAGGSIEIQGGCFGHGASLLSAHRNIKVKFVQNTEIECDGDLYVSDGLFHCEVRVGKSILVGVNAGKGQLNGGRVAALELIKARVAGSTSSTVTHLSVGVQPQHREILERSEQQRQLLKTQLEETIKALIYIRTKALNERKDEIPVLEEQRNELSARVSSINDKIGELRSALERTTNIGKIVVTDKVYSGVKLSMGEMRKNIDEDMASCLFSYRQRKSGHEIVLGPLMKSDFEFQKV